MRLEPLIKPELTFVLRDIKSRDELLGKLADSIANASENIDGGALEAALTAREAKAPTSTPEGVALPHAMFDGAEHTFVAVAKVQGGVSFGKQGHPRSDVIFVLVGPPDSAWQHVSILARVARICHTPNGLRRLRASKDARSLYENLCAEDARHV